MYSINEIFYSLQGEGFWTGTPAVFVRFSACNLACPFCDTDFSSGKTMGIDAILSEIQTLGGTCRRIILTGGEPSLQVDEALLNVLHENGYTVHIETNGTKPLPQGIDWICLSPKTDWIPTAKVVLNRADELKLVYTGQDVSHWESFNAEHFYLQPCSCQNTEKVVTFIMSHPIWNLSLQTHKLLNIR